MPTFGKRSRSRVATWIAIVLALVASLLVATATTAHAEPPPPTKVDRCGKDQDFFVVDDNEFDYYADRYWNDRYVPGEMNSTGGQLVVMVYAYDQYGTWHDISLEFTDVPCPPAASNRFWLKLGECQDRYDDKTRLTAFIKNTDDEGDQAIDDIWAEPIEVDRGSGTAFYIYFEIGRVEDGATGSVNLGESLGGKGLDPGTYYVKFWQGQGDTYLGKSGTVTVPSCDGTDPDPDPPRARKPWAKLTSFYARGGVAVQVLLSNRKVAKANVFKVQRIYKTKIQKVVKVKVAKHRMKVLRFYHIKKGTKIKVFYKLRNGKWDRILSQFVKRPNTS